MFRGHLILNTKKRFTVGNLARTRQHHNIFGSASFSHHSRLSHRFSSSFLFHNAREKFLSEGKFSSLFSRNIHSTFLFRGHFRHWSMSSIVRYLKTWMVKSATRFKRNLVINANWDRGERGENYLSKKFEDKKIDLEDEKGFKRWLEKIGWNIR